MDTGSEFPPNFSNTTYWNWPPKPQLLDDMNTNQPELELHTSIYRLSEEAKVQNLQQPHTQKWKHHPARIITPMTQLELITHTQLELIPLHIWN